MGGLVDVLRGHLARPEAVDEAGATVVEPLLAAIVETGRGAWPGVALSDETFVGRVGHHFPANETLLAWLRQVRASDLYLATACANRVPNAIEAFDREFLASIPAILARGGMRSAAPDEIRQRVLERLFVGPTKIGDYSGRGALGSWVQVVALRIAIDTAKEQGALPIAEAIEIENLELVGTDPELGLLKERYREPFQQALRAALRSLSSEQRNLLRLHFVDGIKLERLAEMFWVHRATIVRRIAQAREATFSHVRVNLQSELGIDDSEFEALLGLVRSRLDVNLSALLPSIAT